eukprot:TRINITY_DN3151_c0_g1_i1.p1 TRINITY_DN3151_c0_g1~~TRINITY_DN3151_c0_g1_i1.p1  ORF type:complete len:454 (-),score=179.42 TRINITY_DN3151_c0_g1_i1:122-1396(-)
MEEYGDLGNESERFLYYKKDREDEREFEDGYGHEEWHGHGHEEGYEEERGEEYGEEDHGHEEEYGHEEEEEGEDLFEEDEEEEEEEEEEKHLSEDLGDLFVVEDNHISHEDISEDELEKVERNLEKKLSQKKKNKPQKENQTPKPNQTTKNLKRKQVQKNLDPLLETPAPLEKKGSLRRLRKKAPSPSESPLALDDKDEEKDIFEGLSIEGDEDPNIPEGDQVSEEEEPPPAPTIIPLSSSSEEEESEENGRSRRSEESSEVQTRHSRKRKFTEYDEDPDYIPKRKYRKPVKIIEIEEDSIEQKPLPTPLGKRLHSDAEETSQRSLPVSKRKREEKAVQGRKKKKKLCIESDEDLPQQEAEVPAGEAEKLPCGGRSRSSSREKGSPRAGRSPRAKGGKAKKSASRSDSPTAAPVAKVDSEPDDY